MKYFFAFTNLTSMYSKLLLGSYYIKYSMRIFSIIPLLILFIGLFNSPAIAMADNRVLVEVKFKDEQPPEVLRAFLNMYNDGSRDSIKSFIKHYYHPEQVSSLGGIDAAVDEWIELYATYGPLEYKFKQESQNFFWLNGTISKSWIGLSLNLKEIEGKIQIVGYGLRKGTIPPGAPDLPELSNESIKDTLKSYFREMEKADLFSGSVIIGRYEEILFKGGYGFANKQEQKEMTVHTSVNIASTGKMFTGVAIAQLVEKGKVAFDDPLSKFIPEYPDHIADKVTVHHLLTHTSGIELDNIKAFNEATKSAESVEELLEAQLKYIAQLEGYSDFELPEKFDYTNEGINLLGVIIERVSGQTYKDYLKDHIFQPAGMVNSGVEYKASSKPIAIGYTFDGSSNYNERVPNSPYLPEQAYPAGAHYSSAEDLFLFFKALLNYKLLERPFVDELITMQIVEAELPSITYGYGYAFEVFTRKGTKMVGHAGGMPGVSTKVELYPEHEIWIIVLSNYDTAGTVATTYLRELLIP